MDALLLAYLAFAGLVASLLVMSQISRWVVLLVNATQRHGGDFLGPAKRRLLWTMPLTLLHPGLWLLVLIPWLSVRVFTTSSHSGWRWFFGGLAIGCLLQIGNVLALIVRYRRASATPKSPGSSARGGTARSPAARGERKWQGKERKGREKKVAEAAESTAPRNSRRPKRK